LETKISNIQQKVYEGRDDNRRRPRTISQIWRGHVEKARAENVHSNILVSLGSSKQLVGYDTFRRLIRVGARMDQLSFASLDYAAQKKRTKRDVILAEMDGSGGAVGHTRSFNRSS
jgi:hypothetical protein